MPPGDGTLSLLLFVAGDSPDSALAIANLNALFPNGQRAGVLMEIVDVRAEPERAALERIVVTPTLLKVSPPPPCRIIGNLKNRDALLRLLGVQYAAGSGLEPLTSVDSALSTGDQK